MGWLVGSLDTLLVGYPRQCVGSQLLGYSAADCRQPFWRDTREESYARL